MKRILSLTLSLMLVLSLVSCAQQTSAPQTSSSQSAAPIPSDSAPQESQASSGQSALGDLSVTYDLSVGQMGTGIKAAMVVLAHEMGYYEEEGLNVELTQISNLNDGLTAITLGKLDVLPFGVIPTCTFIAQGADLTVIGGTIAEGSACVALPEREEEFQDIRSFAGKTVACVRAETGHMMMKDQMRQAGVDMDTVDFVELDGFQSVVEAVLKGTADVGFVNSGFEQNAVTQGLVVPFFVGEYTPDNVCCRQTTSGVVVEEKRPALVRFEVANLRAMKLMYDDPETTIAALAAFSGQSGGYVKYCIYDGCMKISMDPAKNRVVEFFDVMKANGDIDADVENTMADHVDSTIYLDALNVVLERYPDDVHFQEMLETYDANNL